MFQRIRKRLQPNKETELKAHKLPGTSQGNTIDDGEVIRWKGGSGHSDTLPSFQSAVVRNVNINNASHRFIQMKMNPIGNKHTDGLVTLLLNKPPKYFMYVAPDFDIDEMEELDNMNHVHLKWQKVGFYRTFKQAFAQALGINSACIVKAHNEKDPEFLVFNTSHIDGDRFEKDKYNKITRIRFKYKSTGEGYVAGTNYKQKNESRTIDADIGGNAVLITPLKSVDNSFGSADITKLWLMIIYRGLNRYYSMVFNKKGGIASRVFMGPDNISPKWRKRLEVEAMKGIESELLEILYPASLANNAEIDPSKISQWIENKAGNVDFNKLDDMLSNDSPFPPSFFEGAPSGALGGVAPKVDFKKENDILLSYVDVLTKAVHDCNEVFFGIRERNYAVVPYLAEDIGDEAELDEEGNPIQEGNDEDKKDKQSMDKSKDESKNKKVEKTEKKSRTKVYNSNDDVIFKRSNLKKHSSNATVTYTGNLFHSGSYTYSSYDWLTGETYEETQIMKADSLIEMIDNPLKVHEAYLDIEHDYISSSGNVGYGSAIAKIVLKGWKRLKDNSVQDICDIIFKKEFDPGIEEIKLSAVYSCETEELNGELYQTNMDFKSGALVHYPASEDNGLTTTATKQHSKLIKQSKDSDNLDLVLDFILEQTPVDTGKLKGYIESSLKVKGSKLSWKIPKDRPTDMILTKDRSMTMDELFKEAQEYLKSLI